MNSLQTSPSPKVVFVNRFYSPDHSATSQILTDLASGLAARGFSVHVICSRQLYGRARAQLPRQSIIDGVSIYRIATTCYGRTHLMGRAVDYATFYLSCAWRLARLLDRGDTVIAKTDPPLISIVTAALARAKGARAINWLQDIFPEIASQLNANPLPYPFHAVLRRLRDWSLRSAQMNVVLGQRMSEMLQRRGIPRATIRVIENWAEKSDVEPRDAQASSLRSRLGLADRFVVGYSGNFGRAHEYHTLLEAAKHLQADDDVIFLMVGGGTGMTALEAAIKSCGLRNFHFLSYVPRASLADSLAAADVHLVSLLPPLEGLIVPSKFYGIVAAARPVIFIGDENGELAQLIRTHDTGFVVNVGDAPELVRRLRELRTDAAARRRMGWNGRRLYCERYTPQRALEQWVEMLRPANGHAYCGPHSQEFAADDGQTRTVSTPPPPTRTET